jgi:hypothetical protein
MKTKIKKHTKPTVTISETYLDYDSFSPFVELTFKTNIALDKEMFVILDSYKTNISELMADEYRMMIEPEMEKIRERLGLKPTEKVNNDR